MNRGTLHARLRSGLTTEDALRLPVRVYRKRVGLKPGTAVAGKLCDHCRAAPAKASLKFPEGKWCSAKCGGAATGKARRAGKKVACSGCGALRWFPPSRVASQLRAYRCKGCRGKVESPPPRKPPMPSPHCESCGRDARNRFCGPACADAAMKRRVEIEGVFFSTGELAKASGVPRYTIWARLRRGVPVLEAISRPSRKARSPCESDAIRKRCCRCRSLKSATQFDSDKSRRDGRSPRCKGCQSAAYRNRRSRGEQAVP